MIRSGSVRQTKQTLAPKEGGFGYVKTLLLSENLGNEKRGGLCKTPMMSFSAETPSPCYWRQLCVVHSDIKKLSNVVPTTPV